MQRLPESASGLPLPAAAAARWPRNAGGWRAMLGGDWLLAVAGVCILYAPLLADLAGGLWASPEQAHGPLILAVALYLLWSKREALGRTDRTGRAAGALLFAIGLVFQLLGRIQSIELIELGSFILVVAALVLLLAGTAALRAVWFPLFFLVFMLPLPGPVVDAVTMPMKVAVSHVVAEMLFAGGYPISRTGVVLHVGHYQLLVADACAGLQTLFTLEALGLLYLNLVRSQSWWRNVLLALLILPISFTANVVRVLALTLVTYHLGDEAGQGFLHQFAGMVLFISGLLLVVATDGLLRLLLKENHGHRIA